MEKISANKYSKACSTFAMQLTYEQIPSSVIDHIKLLILDWLGCAVRGSATANAEPAKTLVRSMGGNSQCRALFMQEKTSVMNASFLNGYVGHIMEMDDVDRESITHPATVVVPAALAIAEWQGKNGKDALAAIVAGYEIMLRVGAAITPAHYEIWHTTATSGPFGSAMAAGKLLGLSQQQMAWALGNAGTMAAGLWQFLDDGAMSKFLHAGKAASNGVLAACLAAENFTGATDILEGKRGFFAGFARQAIDGSIFEDFGTRYRAGTVSVKPYPCCRHTHSSIDAAFAVRDVSKLEDISSITLDVYGVALKVAGNMNPQTSQDAKFSLRYCVASTLLKGIPSEKSFAETALYDNGIRELMDKITVRENTEFTAMMPAQWPAKIEIVYTDGTKNNALVEAPKGDPDNPVSWEEAIAKFSDMVSGVLSEKGCALLVDACRNLESLETAETLLAIINDNLVDK